MSVSLEAGVRRDALQRQLHDGLVQLGLTPDPSACDKLLAFVGLLTGWNRTYNLTAVRDPEKIVSVHLLDSLAVMPYLEGVRILDVGSGGGLPGIPLAILRSESAVTLLDSSQKKTAFLRQAVATLPVPNAAVVTARVEDWHPAERFDLIVSRAYAALGDFVRSAGHLLADGGSFAALKGGWPGAHPGILEGGELAGVPPGLRVRDIRRLSVPGLDAERHLVVLERA